MNVQEAGWQTFQYPLEVGKEICHKLMSDIRKKIWLIQNNMYSEDATHEISEAEGSRYANIENANEPTGTYPTGPGWWGRNGEFRAGNALGAYDSGGSSDKYYGPGVWSVWYEGKFGNDIEEAGASDYDIKGMVINYGGSGVDEILIEDKIIWNDPLTVYNETVYGNLLVGTPIEIFGSAPTEAKGYWRIKARRLIDIGGTNYAAIELEDFHGDEDLVLQFDYGYAGTYTGSYGGEIACDFGGDWYTFCPRGGVINGNVDFLIQTACIHKSSTKQRVDTERRPPDGGKVSSYESGWWIRTVNPYRYHHYDANAQRFIAFSQSRESAGETVEYFTIIESWRMLPIATDPKEQVPPYWAKDKDKTDFQIAGNKVEIKREHITDWDTMLAAQGSQSHLRTIPSNLVRTSDTTYRSVNWTSTETYCWGMFPPMANDSKWNYQRTIWQERKMGSRCIWPWLELMADRGFVAPVNDVYRTNWLEVHKDWTDPTTKSGDPAGTTYGQKWLNGSWNLAGYRPEYNDAQGAFDSLNSKYWGENGSAMEKILSDLGDYDWYFDKTNLYVPYDIKHSWGNIYYSQASNHDSPPDVGPAAAEWEHPTPAGTWRKIPKWTMGYVDGDTEIDPGVDGWMRAYEEGAPAGDSYRDSQHGGAGSCASHWEFCSLYSYTTPGVGEFGDYNNELKMRHGEVHNHDSIYYWEKTYLILMHVLDVLGEMRLLNLTPYATEKKILLLYDENEGERVAQIQEETPEACFAEYNRIVDVQLLEKGGPPDWDQTENSSAKLGYFRLLMYGPGWGWYGEAETDLTHTQVAFVFTGIDRIYGLRSAIMSLEVMEMTNDYSFGWGHIPGEVAGYGSEIITQLAYGEGSIFRWASIGQLIGNTGFLNYAHFWLNNAYTFPVTGAGEEDRYVTIETEIDIKPILGMSLIGIMDWDLFPDNIWARDKTYAKCFLTGVNDTQPPVHEPIRFFNKPIIYDANRSEIDITGVSYLSPDYIPAFRIRMAAELMEDLEDHSVLYSYVGEGGAEDLGSDLLGDLFVVDRVFDVLLEMGPGSPPGNYDDLIQACADGLEDSWTFKTRARDNASAYGSGQSNNATVFSGTEQVVAEAGTVCPPKAVWKTEPHVIGGNVVGELYAGFGPEGDRDCSYEFETVSSSWDSGWQDGDPESYHEDGEDYLPKYYRGRYRTNNGEILSQWSDPVLVEV